MGAVAKEAQDNRHPQKFSVLDSIICLFITLFDNGLFENGAEFFHTFEARREAGLFLSSAISSTALPPLFPADALTHAFMPEKRNLQKSREGTSARFIRSSHCAVPH